MGQGRPNHLGPQIDQGIGFYKKGAGRVVPVPILVVGGQGQTVDALWNAECARLVDAGNEQTTNKDCSDFRFAKLRVHELMMPTMRTIPVSRRGLALAASLALAAIEDRKSVV